MALSTAAKMMLALCICPVVATPVIHKPTRDKIAKVAGYKPANEVSKKDEPCLDPSILDEIEIQAGSLEIPDIPGFMNIPDYTTSEDNPNNLFPSPYGPLYPPYNPGETVDPTIPVSTPASAALLVTGVGMIGLGMKRK